MVAILDFTESSDLSNKVTLKLFLILQLLNMLNQTYVIAKGALLEVAWSHATFNFKFRNYSNVNRCCHCGSKE